MSDHRRDIKFEVQYILSLTLVVFGLLSISAVQAAMNKWVAYLVIFFLAGHLSIFNIAYGFGYGMNLKVDMVESMDRWSWPTLLVIGGSFVFLVTHATLAVIYHNFRALYGPISAQWEVVLMYLAPTILVTIMGYSVKRHGFDALSSFDGVNIKVVPEYLRVFQTSDDSKALLVKVENMGDETFSYELDIDIPNIVTLHMGTETLNDNHSNEGEVEPGRADRYSFEITHTSEEHSAEELVVTIDADGASYTTEVELELAV